MLTVRVKLKCSKICFSHVYFKFTLVIMGCGSKKFENCTYFESTKGLTGMCNAEICKCSEAVCQIRLDFTTFILTGPVSIATDTLNSNQLILNGVMSAAAGNEYSLSLSKFQI